MSRVLVVPDIHEPVAHPAALAFCQDLYEEWNCNKVVFIGDVVDHHAISFHANHPECPGPMDEYELAYNKIQKWYKAFPKAHVCCGNHDMRVLRLAESVNIPSKYIRDHNEVWDTKKWEWVDSVTIDDNYLFHGTGCSGMHPAFNTMRLLSMSVTMGHTHSNGGIKWLVNERTRMFGMDVGCLIDDEAMNFAYGKVFKKKSVLSTGVIIDGIPYYEMMPCARGEKYHRSRFK